MINNWEIKKLGEVILDIKDGGTPSRTKPEYFGGNVNWCVVKDIKPEIYETRESLTDIGLSKCSAKVWPINSVIISLGATIGQIGISKIPVATKQGISGIVVDSKKILPEFLVYFLNFKKSFIQGIASGATIKEVRPTKLKEALNVPVPSLSEQQRIVAVLDEAFNAIDKAKNIAEQNLKKAKELFESYLQSVFVNPGKDWEENNFENCIDKVVYTNKIQRNRFLKTGEFPIISQEKNLVNGYWNKKEDLFKIKKPVIIFGDHTQILKYIDFDFVLGADGVKILQPKDFLYPKFFYYFVNSISLKNLGYARHYRLLKEKQVFHPKSFPEQKSIATKLDALFAETKKLEAIYKQKLADLEELKKSVLKHAFNGDV